MKLGDSYGKMGERFLDRSAAAYARVVKDYPLSQYVDEAKSKLQQMERPIPEPDPAAVARMKYEQENRTKAGIVSKGFSILSHSPDTRMAAKTGTPAMTSLQPSTPVSVPTPAAAPAATGATADVTIQTVGDSTALDQNPDARAAKPAEPAATATPEATTPPAPANKKQETKKKKK